MVDKSTFDATRDALIKFEVEPFVAMIDQIKSDGKCSGDFDDAKWPRNERLVSGQKHLVDIGLPSLDKFQKQCRASALAARISVDPLLVFLSRKLECANSFSECCVIPEFFESNNYDIEYKKSKSYKCET